MLNKTAVQIIQEQCASCHFNSHKPWQAYTTDESWLNAQGVNGSYIDKLNPENSLLLRRMKFYGQPTSTMPVENASAPEPFSRAHYDIIEKWIKSLAKVGVTDEGDGTVTITQSHFTEQGVSATLQCTNPSDSLMVTLNDPAKVVSSSIMGYAGLAVRASGVTSVSDLVTMSSNGLFTLKGEGIDIWDTKVYFNALSRPVINGELDLTLDVLGVDGVTHDFAKVGLLVSSTDDLSGKLAFVHWSGRSGLAEDSGEGVLNQYRQIIANPNASTVLTPTPVRLRVVYENSTLKVGGCIGCDAPAVGLPKIASFVPKRVYIVASSHDVGAIAARLSLRDAYAQAGQFEQLASKAVTCVNGTATVNFTGDMQTSASVLQLGIYRTVTGMSQVASTARVVKEYTDAASCELQGDLLAPTLRRLSELQIKNSIVDIFLDEAGKDIFAANVWPNMEDGAKLIGMNAMADKLNVNNLNFERFYEAISTVADTVLAKNNQALNCSLDSSDACVGSFIDFYAPRIWRRPLTTTELSQLKAAYVGLADNRTKLDFALQALLLSSNFVFRSEIGKLDQGVQTLTNYEMVSVLSYSVLNSTPDATLLSLAAKTTPLSKAELSTQIDRLFADSRANHAMMEVYKDYLKLDLVLTRPKEAALNFTDAVRKDVLSSAELMLENTIANNPRYMDVFKGSNYYLNSNIDDLFGKTVTHTSLQAVAINSQERMGILNHPAFLAVHSTLSSSGIVKRGVFSLEQFLCQALPTPPGNVMPVPIPAGIDPTRTSERDLLRITHSAQSACIGCHQVIDPAGFGFENFDVIGRYRTIEKNNVTIDASGVLNNVGDHVLMYNTSAQYATELAASPQMNSCVSRRFLESFLGQDLEMSACELKKYQGLLQSSGGNVKDLLVSLIQLESFSKRH